MKAWILALCLVCPTVALAQSADTGQTQQSPNYANFSIMPVSPAGGAVVLMHNPKNELENVDVGKTKEAFAAGYVPARVAEISELITLLNEEVVRLRAENAILQSQQLKTAQPASASAGPSPAEIEAQQKAQRRQQLLQTWLILQGANRPQGMDIYVRDCTRYPSLCVGR
jgi:hypothetical protein